jgi:hypothetical protein
MKMTMDQKLRILCRDQSWAVISCITPVSVLVFSFSFKIMKLNQKLGIIKQQQKSCDVGCLK